MVAPGNFWRHSATAEVVPGLALMKRKVAAIFAADIAGYSRSQHPSGSSRLFDSRVAKARCRIEMSATLVGSAQTRRAH